VKRIDLTGFTIIEVLVAILIVGIILAIGDMFFLEGVRIQNRIAEEKYDLQRDAQYAMNFIINGTRMNNEYRVGLGTSGLRIINDPNSMHSDDPHSDQITMDLGGQRYEIYTEDSRQLFLENRRTGERIRILPLNNQEALNSDPTLREYRIFLDFTQTDNIIEIKILLRRVIETIFNENRIVEAELHSAISKINRQ